MGLRRIRDRGFTLIELMLVSAIVGLLASIAIPKFGNLIDKAKESAIKGNLGALRSALAIYFADNESLYPKAEIPSSSWGLYCLQDKYLDLERVTFTLPRYAIAISGEISSQTAHRLYAPYPLGGRFLEYNTTQTNIWVKYLSFPTLYPTYATYRADPNGPVNHADIRIFELYDLGWPGVVAGELKDLSGRAWSTW